MSFSSKSIYLDLGKQFGGNIIFSSIIAKMFGSSHTSYEKYLVHGYQKRRMLAFKEQVPY